ncbi:hypothetical protein JY437_00755 [Stenotrophomonas maltophilia]|nr:MULTISPECIES: hypothetical protein [Stenotrophomonas]MBN5019684.1 hypothetical protein [Stenotrophomonas maltophilia]MCU0999667.1 hypothetical protein [Stenotrophomonas maltophilia]
MSKRQYRFITKAGTRTTLILAAAALVDKKLVTNGTMRAKPTWVPIT